MQFAEFVGRGGLSNRRAEASDSADMTVHALGPIGGELKPAAGRLDPVHARIRRDRSELGLVDRNLGGPDPGEVAFRLHAPRSSDRGVFWILHGLVWVPPQGVRRDGARASISCGPNESGYRASSASELRVNRACSVAGRALFPVTGSHATG
jgi:hypothetical protein